MHYRSVYGPAAMWGLAYNNDPDEWPCYCTGTGWCPGPHGTVSPAPNGYCEYPFTWWGIHPSSYDFGFIAPSKAHNVTWKASGVSYNGQSISDESDWAEPVGMGDGPVHGPTEHYDPENLPYHNVVTAIPISLDEYFWFTSFTGIPIRPIIDPIWRLYGDDVINSNVYFSDPTEVEPVFYANMLTPGNTYLLGVTYTNTGGATPFEEVIYAPISLDCPEADLSGDCFVDLVDFAMLAEQWLTGDGMGGPM